jgi:23S rRNA (cytosine1962-C5)-methyltransferase
MAVLVNPLCILEEDEHVLIADKPAGWNTHSPASYAGEGIYEWLKNREPRLAKLAIIHRLDKQTSGLLLFSKTKEANRSLTKQFSEGKVQKEYALISTKPPPKRKFVVRSCLKRIGERYASIAGSTSGAQAETEFELVQEQEARYLIVARPRTGRTHQIRVHASENGFPILGDTLYGGEPAKRLYLESQALSFTHVDGEPYETGMEHFGMDGFLDLPNWVRLRSSIMIPAETNSHRIINGAADGFPNLYADRFGSFVLTQSANPLKQADVDLINEYYNPRGIYHKVTTARVREKSPDESAPQHLYGEAAPDRFTIHENRVIYEISFTEGYSVGIFLDQRDNRRRLLTNYIAPDFYVSPQPNKVGPAVLSGPPEPPPTLKGIEVLNTFAYTCAFSVCAALAGARVTSLDLSKKYLDWGRRNFQLNSIDPAQHDFIYGDVFDWLKRFAKKQRQFDVVLLDPPTFSKSKESGIFRAEDDYARLVTDALKVLKPGGVLFASSNAARWAPEDFVKTVHAAIAKSGRKIICEHYVPQPPDFPISKAEPAYLKTVWLRIG